MNPSSTDTSVNLFAGVQWPGLGALPRCMALPPLFGQLITRCGLGIRSLTDDGRLAEEAVPTQFQGVDGESLARRFLGDLDRFVGMPFAGALCGQPGLRSALVQSIGCTLTLAEAMAADLQPVFSGAGDGPDRQHGADDANDADGLASARDLLRRQLCDRLLTACRCVVLVQYEAQTRLPWTGTPGLAPLALHGPARIVDDGVVVQFAAARTGLAVGDRFATFIANVDEPARHRWLGGTLQTTCTHAEYGLPAIGVPPGCDAPVGPCFVPLQGEDGLPAELLPSHPGTLRMPVPLRSFPAPPVILLQTASPTHAQPASLDEMPRWTYALTVRHEFAAQDTLQLTVDFNQDAPVQQAAAPPSTPDALFDALAQYAAVADKLWALLAPLSDPAAVASAAPNGVNAARSFVQLASEVAQHWSDRQPSAAGKVALQDGCREQRRSLSFDLRATCSKDGKTLQGISLKWRPAQPGPVGPWPGVTVVLGSAEVSLEAQIATSDTMVYRPPAGTVVPALDPLSLRLAWGGLHVAEVRSACARSAVVRNQDLLYDPLHADDPTPPTHPRLLLKTAVIGAAGVVQPLIQCPVPQEIRGVDMKAALSDAVQALIPPAAASADLMASWQLSCVHEPVRASPSEAGPLRVQTSLSFCPPVSLDRAAEALAVQVQALADANRRPAAGDGWLFGLTLFSERATAQRPLFCAQLLYRPG